jgi:hypothetical protein
VVYPISNIKITIHLTTQPRLKPKTDHVGFVVGKVALEFFSGGWFSPVSHHSNNATYSFTYHPGSGTVGPSAAVLPWNCISTNPTNRKKIINQLQNMKYGAHILLLCNNKNTKHMRYLTAPTIHHVHSGNLQNYINT